MLAFDCVQPGRGKFHVRFGARQLQLKQFSLLLDVHGLRTVFIDGTVQSCLGFSDPRTEMIIFQPGQHLATMHALARLGGAKIEVRRSYPPWEPDHGSSLLSTARSTYARLFGTEPALTVVHGGLECAVLGQRLSGVEMISIGPEIVGPHAPGERVRISSTQRFYRLLGALLEDLSR